MKHKEYAARHSFPPFARPGIQKPGKNRPVFCSAHHKEAHRPGCNPGLILAGIGTPNGNSPAGSLANVNLGVTVNDHSNIHSARRTAKREKIAAHAHPVIEVNRLNSVGKPTATLPGKRCRFIDNIKTYRSVNKPRPLTHTRPYTLNGMPLLRPPGLSYQRKDKHNLQEHNKQKFFHGVNALLK
jgi:hypothetical protein